MFKSITDNEPDFVNEEGSKWWLEKYLTDWARKPDVFGTTLDMNAYIVESKDGYKSFVLIDKEGVVDHSQQSEAIAVKIDVLKLLKRDSESVSVQRQDLKPNEQDVVLD